MFGYRWLFIFVIFRFFFWNFISFFFGFFKKLNLVLGYFRFVIIILEKSVIGVVKLSILCKFVFIIDIGLNKNKIEINYIYVKIYM